MQSTPAHETIPNETLIQMLHDDPWSLNLEQRQAVAQGLADSHGEWLDRLATLVEPPAPNASFPAFLLGTGRYASLAAAIGTATHRRELDVSTADELQRFVDLYRDYMTRPEPA